MAGPEQATQAPPQREAASGPAAPAISLPKGGGAIRGIGEKFTANPATGTGTLNVPLPVSRGREGGTPSLSLAYDSGAGNGPWGLGWSLSVPEIARKTDKGLPRYDDAANSDTFVLSGAEDLVPALVEQGGAWIHRPQERTLPDGSRWSVRRYRPRVEGLWARIERWTHMATGETYWRSISKDNVTSVFGRTRESRIADPSDPRRVFSWLLSEVHDDRGNATLYRYVAEDDAGVDATLPHERNRTSAGRSANRYLKRVLYGNGTPRGPDEDLAARGDWLFEIVLDYGEHDDARPGPRDTGRWSCRADPFSSLRAGFEVRTYRLCRRVLMFHHFPGEPGIGADCLVRAAELQHVETPTGSFLTAIVEAGFRRDDGGYVRKALPPLEFEYTPAAIGTEVRDMDAGSGVDGGARWVDLDGEGMPGLLTEEGDEWWYRRNVSAGDGGGPRFEAPAPVSPRPPVRSLGSGRQQLLDLAGDGRLDAVELEPPAGFYERTAEGGWSEFTPFATMPNLDWRDPELRFVDLTGDGHADVLVGADELVVWHPSLAEAGFGEAVRVHQGAGEDTAPRLVAAGQDASIHLADMSGDGLSDLVRIRNGEVCYWPSLGHGRFGRKVTMGHAPLFDDPQHFDPGRLRLADVDGSGPTDLVYLAAGETRVWLNECGNAWSACRAAPALAGDLDHEMVSVADVFGTGTACLVVTSRLPADAGRPLRYLELIAGGKPHLLAVVRNNLGAETRVRYVPSTRFQQADRAARRPWLTRLAFPVHVVERVETLDHVARTRFVTRYAYHHGCFDGHEREFRGFGMVEQWDTEHLQALGSVAANEDAASHVPPVLTRTWFHTGAEVAGGLSRRLESEYYREPGLTDAQARGLLLEPMRVPDTIPAASGARVPFAPSAHEAREACRALRGTVLRQEVYARDGSEAQDRPYRVSQATATLEFVQPRAGNRHAVVLVHPRESVTFEYDRALTPAGAADPRVQHETTLEADAFGNALRTVTIAYGRRRDETDLGVTAEHRSLQRRALVTCAENAFTNAIDAGDAHRAPVESETRTYQLYNAVPDGSPAAPLVRFAALTVSVAAAAAQDDLPYGDHAGAGAGAGPRWRLLAHARTTYRSDDLSTVLPLGTVAPRALRHQEYRLALPEALVDAVFQRGSGATAQPLIGDRTAVLGMEAGYVRGAQLKAQAGFPASDRDDDWWAPSGCALLSPGVADGPAQERAWAADHFHLPVRFTDPFGATSLATYDAYDLLPSRVQDASGNVTTAGSRDAAGALIDDGNDYRVLAPRVVSDANRNRSMVAHDALGLLTGTAVAGKPEERLGDDLEGFDPDLPDAVVRDHLVRPLVDPHAVLGSATTRILYDAFAYQRTAGDPGPQPVVACTISRETHVSELRSGTRSKVQHAFVYGDGTGREIQRKLRAEGGRWVASGWTVFNNKGHPVRRYEPFFTATPAFEFDVAAGVSPIVLYDLIERAVATLYPNHAHGKVVYAPWRREDWDPNDTALHADLRADPDVGAAVARLLPAAYAPSWHEVRAGGALGPAEQTAAAKAAAHADTPTRAYLDPLGRPYVAVAHNRLVRDGSVTEERHTVLTRLDVQGQTRTIEDALGRVVERTDFDMLGNEIRSAGMETGMRWALHDAGGRTLRLWDARGHAFRTVHDVLRRPVETWVRPPGGAERLLERTTYGESEPDPESGNLRGRVAELRDGGGLVVNRYGFRGGLSTTARRLPADHRAAPDWSQPVALEAATYSSARRLDALERPVELTLPDGTRVQPRYNAANLLEAIRVRVAGAPRFSEVVRNVDYDAKGQRTLVEYGNGAVTTFEYDRDTLRLTRLATTASGGRVQDLAYVHDAAGNITEIDDRAQPALFFRNAVVEARAELTYDAAYRLVEATGREHLGLTAAGAPRRPSAPREHDRPRTGVAHRADGGAMGRYRERYDYDAAGNLVRSQHRGTDPASPGWTRTHTYAEPSRIEPAVASNRLSAVRIGSGTPQPFTYDEHGNATSMAHLAAMRWDERDRLAATARQAADGGVPETTYHTYDATGRRVRKVTDRYAPAGAAPARRSERIYLEGFEINRRWGATGGGPRHERQTVVVMLEDRPVALVETRTLGDDGTPQRLVRYQLADHAGSTAVELDSAGDVLTHEEYHPYGTTAHQAVTARAIASKRYRYGAKERDEESGLGYHGARYYAPWLGRWISPDPIGTRDGPNLYRYAGGNPIGNVDPTGTQALTIDPDRTSASLLGVDEPAAPERGPPGGEARVHSSASEPEFVRAQQAFRADPFSWAGVKALAFGWAWLMSSRPENERGEPLTTSERNRMAGDNQSKALGYAMGFGFHTTRGLLGEDVDLKAVEGERFQNFLALLGPALRGMAMLQAFKTETQAFQQWSAAYTQYRLNYRAALSGANRRERVGLRNAIQQMAWRNWKLSEHQFKYSGNRGLDLHFEGVGENLGFHAFNEAKGLGGLGALQVPKTTLMVGGFRQGGEAYIGMSLATYIERGGTNVVQAEMLMRKLRLGEVKSFATSGSNLWELSFFGNPNFTRQPWTARLLP